MSMNLTQDEAVPRPAMLAPRALPRRGSALTRRERECIVLLAHGSTDDEIAGALCISHATVRFHLDGARRKLVARSRAHLAALAVAEGVVQF